MIVSAIFIVKLSGTWVFTVKELLEAIDAVNGLGDNPDTDILQESRSYVPFVVVIDILSVFAVDGGAKILFIWKLNWEFVAPEEKRELKVTRPVALFPVQADVQVIDGTIPKACRAKSPVQYPWEGKVTLTVPEVGIVLMGVTVIDIVCVLLI